MYIINRKGFSWINDISLIFASHLRIAYDFSIYVSVADPWFSGDGAANPRSTTEFSQHLVTECVGTQCSTLTLTFGHRLWVSRVLRCIFINRNSVLLIPPLPMYYVSCSKPILNYFWVAMRSVDQFAFTVREDWRHLYLWHSSFSWIQERTAKFEMMLIMLHWFSSIHSNKLH